MLSTEFIRCLALFVILLQLERVLSIAINKHDVQRSSEAIRNAKSLEMLNYMNPAANPCENFYEFACGSWPKYHKANAQQKIKGLLEVLKENFDHEIRALLTKEDAKNTEMDSLARTLYGSCMQLPAMWNVYLRKLKAMVNEFGEMPLLEGKEWRESDFDWTKTVAEIHHKYGIEIIVGASVLRAMPDRALSSIIVGRPYFALGPRMVYTDAEYEGYRTKYISGIAYNLRHYLSIHYDLAMQTAQEMVNFEIALALGLDDDKRTLGLDEINVLSSVEQMYSSYAPHFDVKRFINTAWGSVPNQTYYEEIRYLSNLVEVMQRAPKRIVANYVFYKLLEKFLYKNTSNKGAQLNECISSVTEYLSATLESLVYRGYNTNQTEEVISGMWQSIKKSFRDELESSTQLGWIPEEARKYAAEKLNLLNIEITGLKLSSFGSGLIFDQSDFFENMKTLLKSLAKFNRDNLHKRTGSAMTNNLENKVTLPVAMLHPYYLWSPSVPMAFNFAKLGSLLAHELIRDFDVNQRQWWNANSAQDFKDRSECFANQYKNYTYGGRALPEAEQQDDNIAANGGLRLAYRAYLKWYQDKSRTRHDISLETYPRLRYTSQQLFFIHFAQMWCADVEPNYKLVETSIDQHTPAEFRVIGSLANLEEFSKEFRCPAGSVMNPANKCRIY